MFIFVAQRSHVWKQTPVFYVESLSFQCIPLVPCLFSAIEAGFTVVSDDSDL